ncbi:hypothetical protein HO173_011540 [Letharia columbiana]|uniref:Uncharacterized protein n=1 Tax=Letharia columbiana TaxID=112416 RepID=A0A8H6KZ12_9LECA|nr:uncharacterized protein HO173_011540 [Letharia columbiana]KAF6229500.1 hypothetical protein HO173_011540 [Letharia columbiana]
MSPESEEKMHGAGRDEKVVMIPEGEEEVDSIREAIVDFGRDSGGRVSTSSPESTIADYILKTSQLQSPFHLRLPLARPTFRQCVAPMGRPVPDQFNPRRHFPCSDSRLPRRAAMQKNQDRLPLSGQAPH